MPARRGRMTTRRALIGLAAVVVLCVLAFAYQTWRAAGALSHARSQATTLRLQLLDGDVAGARRTASDLRDSTSSARGHTDGPLFWIGAHLPLVGQNVEAARASAGVLDAIAQHSLPTLVRLAAAVDDGRLRPHHGRVDLHEVAAFAPEVRRAAAAVDGPADRLAAIDSDGLVFPLDGLVGDLQQQVSDARSAIGTAADAFTVMPTMMGAHGPRTYLLLIMNNAEIRAVGGMPGSWAVLHARNGKLTMGRQGSAHDLGTLPASPVRLRPAERTLYGGLGTDLRDVTTTPDFPRSARLAAALLRAKTGTRVDGVFAVDPVTMGMVLAGTGPVRVLPGVRLTGADVAQVLLNQTYRRLPTQAQQDAFNELVARRIFHAMVGGRGNLVRTVHGLVEGVAQRRVLAWSRHPQIERVLRGNRLAGGLPLAGGGHPHVGVYLNDANADKLEFYLRSDTAVKATGCTDDDRQRLSVTTTLRSVAPASVVKQPVWVTGTGQFAPRGTMQLNVWIYGPGRDSIDSLRVDGRRVTVSGGVHAGHQVATVTVRIAPGASHTVTATMTSPVDQPGDVVVTTTPGMKTGHNPVTEPSACG